MSVVQDSPPYRNALQHPGFATRAALPPALIRTASGGRARSFLFLQGNVSAFFSRLGAELKALGHVVHRVNFNGGDMLFWRLPGAVNFRGGEGDWPKFYERLLDERGVTDIVLFGDCRPMHLRAVEIAKRRGIAVFVLEEGYLRPDWITLERGGVNGFSGLPQLPEDFIELADRLPPIEGGPPIRNSFARRASEDILYHAARVALMWLFPRYRFHAPVEPFLEYAGWVKKIVRARAERLRTAEVLPKIMGGAPFYLLPLQLDSDYQIRVHSKFERIEPALDHIIGSFARRAPAESLLVVKSHPLDNGLTDWRKVTAMIAERAGVADRVVYLEHKNLEELIERSTGVVTINSTVGALAIHFGRPLIALGNAVYNIEGLTFQHGLDRFWTEGVPPTAALYAAFRRVLVHTCLVRGSFYSKTGVEHAVAAAVERLNGPWARSAELAEAGEVALVSVA